MQVHKLSIVIHIVPITYWSLSIRVETSYKQCTWSLGWLGRHLLLVLYTTCNLHQNWQPEITKLSLNEPKKWVHTSFPLFVLTTHNLKHSSLSGINTLKYPHLTYYTNQTRLTFSPGVAYAALPVLRSLRGVCTTAPAPDAAMLVYYHWGTGFVLFLRWSWSSIYSINIYKHCCQY